MRRRFAMVGFGYPGPEVGAVSPRYPPRFEGCPFGFSVNRSIGLEVILTLLHLLYYYQGGQYG